MRVAVAVDMATSGRAGGVRDAPPPSREPIAIIAMACRFPGADSPADLRELLRSGRDAIREVPHDRWDADAYYDPQPGTPGKASSRWLGSVEGLDQFDPHFFGMSPREASCLDPQQRMLLETAWWALESGGIPPASLAGSPCGVFVGIGGSDYRMLHASFGEAGLTRITPQTGTGTALSIAANRLAFLLDLKGPSLAVDTACSSSLVAVHLACQSVWSGETELALAGGVNAILTPDVSIAFSQARMLSPDGRCKVFDADGNGYVRGEGCGIVVLKRLSEAVRDGDHVHAVIRGSAVNTDGRTSSLTVPSSEQQAEVMRAAFAGSELDPSDVGYVEAHGTGTPVGDPIEATAIAGVIGPRRDPEHRVWMGSVKANIGHLETASGIAGTIKAALAIEHGEIYPQIHFRRLNPEVDLAGSPLEIPTRLEAWDSGGAPRLAGVNSFGFGGANAHLVLEQAPPREQPAARSRPVNLLSLSARDSAALRDLASEYSTLCAETGAEAVADVCCTAATGRGHFEHRLAVCGSTGDDLAAQLDAFARGEARAPLNAATRPGRPPRIAFLFTGQGSQYARMGAALRESEPVFRDALERCAQVLDGQLALPLNDVLYGAPGASSRIDETAFTQPALFAVEYALAELWRSWGIEPDMVCGHSVGELVAACVAGALELEDALALIARRAELMGSLPAGGMMAAVCADEQRVADAISTHAGDVSIAAVNAPERVTISGAAEPVEQVIAALEAERVAVQRLIVSHAFHSPLLEPILDDLEGFAEGLGQHEPRCPIAANLHGRLLAEGEQLDAAYWRAHARLPVRFAACVQAMAAAGAELFLEVGPHPTLIGLAKRSLRGSEARFVASLTRDGDDQAGLARALGALYVNGAEPDWAAVYGERRRRPDLPVYPFQRSRHWLDGKSPSPGTAHAGLEGESTGHPLAAQRLAVAEPTIVTPIDLGTLPFLAAHRVQGSVVFPATGYLEMAAAAWGIANGGEPGAVSDVELARPLFLTDGAARELQVTVSPDRHGQREFRIYSRTGGTEWTLHAEGRISAPADGAGPVRLDLDALRSGASLSIDSRELYERLRDAGLDYGPEFQGVREVWLSEGEALGRIERPEELGEAGAYHFHPAMLDACLHVVAAAVGAAAERSGGSAGLALPVRFERLVIHSKPGTELWSHARLRGSDAAGLSIEADVDVYDADGRPVAELRGLQLQRLELDREQEAEAGPGRWLYELHWRDCGQPGSEQSVEQPASWLLIADEDSAAPLAGALREAGAQVAALAPGALNGSEGRSAVEQAIGGLVAPVAAVLVAGEAGADPVLRATETGSQLLVLANALAATSGQVTPRLALVTRGAQLVPGAAAPPAPDQASAWGMMMSLIHEYPQLGCRAIDLDAAEPVDPAALTAELIAADGETHVAHRGGHRYVGRLERSGEPGTEQAAGPLQAPASGSFQLDTTAAGVLDNLIIRPAPRREPPPGTVEIEVEAAGLNFRDVMKALGIYPSPPGEAQWLGDECAGTVTAIGDGIEEIAPGDVVMAVAPGSFASHVITPAVYAVPLPAGLGAEVAAAIPVAFLTAQYALRHVAELAPGERVLIHAAAGGVGQAAIQVARAAGAEIFATAGSEEKREHLRSLGIEHVMDSRSLAFAGQVLQLTEGEGVDVVLNSLSGEAISASLSVLRPFGRFLEIGKRDIYQNTRIGMRPFVDNVSFHAIDLDHLFRSRPQLAARLLGDVAEGIGSGALQPLPIRSFGLSEAPAAFRHLAQARNIGKVSLTLAGIERAPSAATVRADATYLVTGGLGGLGLAVAGWLVEQGARHLVLASRREPAGDAKRAIARMRAAGTEVVTVAADVSSPAEAHRLVELAGRERPPLRGIIHAAGVLDDGLATELDRTRIERVMAPKALGAWNLHRSTMGVELDFFVLFSSAIGLFGAPAQANYAAANAFLDALAALRRSEGLAALSIQWSAWSEVGMAAATGHDGRSLLSEIGSLSPGQGVTALGRLLERSDRGGAAIAVLPFDWARWRELLPGLSRLPLLRDLLEAEAGGDSGTSAEGDAEAIRRLLELPEDERHGAMAEFLRNEISLVLELDPEQLELDVPLTSVGLDSLMALELKNRVEAALGIELPVVGLIEEPTIAHVSGQLCNLLAEPSAAREPAAPQTGPSSEQAAELLEQLDDISDEEVAELLGQMSATTKGPPSR